MIMGKDAAFVDKYFKLKEQNKGSLLMVREGDFYELLGADAQTAAKELGLTVTARYRSENERVPMCGVPFHAADGYIAKLIEKGYKVAVAEDAN